LSLLKLFLEASEGSPGFGHALFYGRLHLGRKLARVKGLARADADLGEARHESFLGWDRRAELQDEVQDVEELRRGLLFCRCQRLDEINGRGGLGCRLAQKRGEWLNLVAGLDLPHVFDVTRVEELRTIPGERQFGLAAKHLLDALG